MYTAREFKQILINDHGIDCPGLERIIFNGRHKDARFDHIRVWNDKNTIDYILVEIEKNSATWFDFACNVIYYKHQKIQNDKQYDRWVTDEKCLCKLKTVDHKNIPKDIDYWLDTYQDCGYDLEKTLQQMENFRMSA